MSSSIRHGQPQPQTQQPRQEAPSGTDLRRGARTMRQADAKTFARGNGSATPKDTEGSKKGGIKQFLKGAKLAITGGVQTAAYERVARASAGWTSMDKAESKAVKTRAKADDGRALMLGALRGTKVDAKTTASVQARDARRAEAKSSKEAARERSVERWANK